MAGRRDHGAVPDSGRHWPLLLPAVGRRLGWRLARGPVSLRLESLAVSPGLPGRFRSVRLSAVDVDWQRIRLHRVRIRATDVRLRGGGVTAAVAELEVELDQHGLDGLLESGLPYARLHLEEDVGRAELQAHPGWGQVELTPTVTDGALVLLPSAVVAPGGGRWTAPARLLPRLRIGAEVLLPGSRLTAAEVRGHRLHLHAQITDVELPLFGIAARERRPSTTALAWTEAG